MICEIRNEKLRVKINTFGAELISCIDIKNHEYIYQPTSVWAGQAKNLFPNVGQIKDGFILVDEIKYCLGQHGFAKDMEFEILKTNSDSVSMSLKSNEKTKRYLPYDFELQISFVLSASSVIQEFKVINLGEKSMYFGLGSHTGFIASKGSYLDFNNNANLMEIERKDMMFLTGRSHSFVAHDGILTLTREIFNQGANILTGFNKKHITLKNKNDGYCVDVDFSDFEYLGIWAPPDSEIAISIMPWCALPDEECTTHDFERKLGNVMLKAKETFCVSQTLTFWEEL